MAENKYAVDCKGRSIDVYDVLNAFGVTCPAAQHAIKKLLMPGKRGHKSELGDLLEARASVDRAIDLAQERKTVSAASVEALVPSGADAQTLVNIISRERAKDPTKWGSQEIATLIAKLDAIFSQGTSLTMGGWDDAPVSYALTDRELRDAVIRDTVDDGQGELPNASPKFQICPACGENQIDGECSFALCPTHLEVKESK